jgi:hypothetical protein
LVWRQLLAPRPAEARAAHEARPRSAGSAERMPSRPATVGGGLPGMPHVTPEPLWIGGCGHQFQAPVVVRGQGDFSYLRHGPRSPPSPLAPPSRYWGPRVSYPCCGAVGSFLQRTTDHGDLRRGRVVAEVWVNMGWRRPRYGPWWHNSDRHSLDRHTTLRGNQGRLRLPPQAARAEGTPRTRPRRCDAQGWADSPSPTGSGPVMKRLSSG